MNTPNRLPFTPPMLAGQTPEAANRWWSRTHARILGLPAALLLCLGCLMVPFGASVQAATSIYEPYSITTLAGLALNAGSTDATGSAARFSVPSGVGVDSAGNVYVADTFNHTIRKVTPGGVVSTLAGLAGSVGITDGTGSAARFYYPGGVAVDSVGNVYVADTDNHTIRKVTAGGTVSTLAGLAGSNGSNDGTGNAARFRSPRGVAVDSAGNVYVTEYGNHTLRMVAPGGVVTTLAGLAGSVGITDGTGSAARFNCPAGVAVDSAGNVYVGDSANHTIRKVTPGGVMAPGWVVTTLAGLAGSLGSSDGTGSAARFHYPSGVAVSSAGNVFVGDTYNHTIRKIAPGAGVTTLGGLAGSSGSSDGTGSVARFRYPYGVAVNSADNVYVADAENHTIRKGVGTTNPCVAAPTNMVLWLPFDETNGIISANLVPGGNNGTRVNGPVAVNGYVAHSLNFNGINQYVQVPSYNAINFGTNDFSIDAWVRRATNDSGTFARIIVDKQDELGSIRGYSLYLGNSGLIRFQLSDGSSTFYSSSLAVANDGQWHHVAVTVDRDNTNGIVFYLDGVADSILGNPVPHQASVSTTFPLRVGSRNTTVSSIFFGGIDEVELFNRVLTPAEIAALFNAGASGKCKPPLAFICPTNKTVNCGTAWTFDAPTATSSCSTNVTVTPSSLVTNGVCPQLITQSWLINDNCGNSNTCSQTVTVVDTTPPVIICPTNKTVICGTAWFFDVPTASDTCSGTNVTVTILGTVTNGLCPQVITRTWRAMDACGNTNTCSQTVTVVDTTPPLFIADPGPGIGIVGTNPFFTNCVAAPTNMVLWLPFDEMNGIISANLVPGGNNGTRVNGPVPVNGYVAHSLSFDGTNQYVEVPSYNAINFGTNDFSIDAWVRWPTNDLFFGIIVDKREHSANAVVRGYSFFLGNTSSGSLFDGTFSFGKVTLGFQLADGGYDNYLSSFNAPQDGQWHHLAVTVDRDNTNGIVFYLDGVADSILHNPVPRQASVSTTFPLRVGSGSSSTSPMFFEGGIDEVELFSRVLTPVEIAALFNAGASGKCKPPLVSTCPTNKTVTCGTAWIFDAPSAFDACSRTNVTVTILSTVTNGPCPVITRTWLATDACGNTNTCSQTVTVVDTTPPVIICPTNKTVQCNSSWNFDLPTAVDACSGTNVTLTILTNITQNLTPCIRQVTRIWQATDACGNTSTCSQTVTVMDTTPPIFIAAAGPGTGIVGTYAGRPVWQAAAVGTTTTVGFAILDNGSPITSGNTDTFFASLMLSGAEFVNVRSYFNTFVYVGPSAPLHVNLPPGTYSFGTELSPFNGLPGVYTITLSSGQIFTVNSGSGAPGPDFFGVVSATPIAWVVFSYNNSPLVLDNFSFATQPLVSTCPTDKTVPCGTNWSFDAPTAYDACSGTNVTVTILSTVTNGPCPIITRTWLATDACGNTNTCSQTVTIVDTTPPVITCATNKTVQCGTAWSFDVPTASDACSGTNVAITILKTVTNGICPQVITRTWKATDACGNTNTCIQIVTVVDDTHPVITCATNKTVISGTAWTFDVPTAFDACSGTNVTIFILNTVTNGSCPQVITRTWLAVDACGNCAICSQTVTVVDSTPPVVLCLTNKIYVALNTNCQLEIPTIHPPASDNCTPTSQLVYTQNPPAGTIVVAGGLCQTVTVTVTDASGNASQCQVLVCGYEGTPPVLICPNPVVVTNCVVPNVLALVSASDNCTASNLLVFTQSPLAGTTIPAGGNSVTVTVTDQSGNAATCVIPLVNSGPNSFLGVMFNTGVDSNKALLPNGAVDPHYTLGPVPAGTPTGNGFYTAPNAIVTALWWGLPSAVSKWITPASITGYPPNMGYHPAGLFTYTNKFVLPSGADPLTASISGRWASDNSATMYLNGLAPTNQVAFIAPQTGWLSWTLFTVNSGFLPFPAVNTFYFVVNNHVSPGWVPTNQTGLRVEFTSAVINCSTCSPPAILLQTPDQSLPLGGTATFNVTGVGTLPVTIQWYHNGLPLANGGHYSGVNTPNLIVTPVSYVDAGTYYAVISNACGSVTSHARTLTVTAGCTWDWAWWDFAQIGSPMKATFGPDLVMEGTNNLGVSSGTTRDFDLPSLGGKIVNVMYVPPLPGDTRIKLPLIAPPGGSVSNYTLITDILLPSDSTNRATFFTIFDRWGNLIMSSRRGAGGDVLSVSGRVDGMAFNLDSPMPLPRGRWNRIALAVVNGQAGDDSVTLSLYVNGKPAGRTSIMKTGADTLVLGSNSVATVFSSPEGTACEMYVACLQFHAVAMTPQMIAGIGSPDNGPIDPAIIAGANQGGGEPPTVLRVQSMGQGEVVGSTTVLRITNVRGQPPFTYQWRKDGTNLIGSISSSLALHNVALNQSGLYSVIVTGPAGTMSSSPCRLIVTTSLFQPPAPQTTAAIRSQGFGLSLLLETGRAFRVQATTDLLNPMWTDVTNFVSTGAALQFIDAAATNKTRRFYRVVSP